MKIRNILQKSKSTNKFVVIILALMAIVIPATAWAAWGPGRPVWDWNDPAQRKGSLTGPVFNSFINTPTYGDERNLTSVSPVGDGNWTDTVNAQINQEVEVHVFIHNNANESTNESGLGIAKNTKVEVYLPEGVGSGFDVGGYISADNATPKRVYDTANIRSNNANFGIEYVPGSAKIYNNSAWKNGFALSDDVVKTGGTPIGYNILNGDLPGCFDYIATVTIRVKLVAPKLNFDKKVTTPGSTEWKKTMVTKPGDTNSWLLDFTNVGSDKINKVVLKDPIPAGLKLVSGSILWVDTAHPNGQQLPDNALSGGGIDLGNYAPQGGGYVRFRTIVDKDFDFNKVSCKLINIGYARADYVSELSSSASLIVDVNGNGNTDDDCKSKPIYSCDALKSEKLADRKFRFTVTSTAKDAKLKSVNYNFGDGTTPLITDKTTVDHTYTNDGSHTVRVSLTFDVGGQVQTATSDACATTVSTDIPTPPKATPQVLPNTGAGDVMGIFAGTSIVGAFVHRFILGHKYNG